MRVAGVVLAAGRASRYRAAGGAAPTKLVERYGEHPLVRYPVEAALAAGLEPVVVVTGHAAAAVEAALDGLRVRFVHNARYASGLASSLETGLLALGAAADAAVILLGDMPLVEAGTILDLVAAAHEAPGWDAVVPTLEGERGNPVLLGRSLFAAASRLTGDEGARRLLREPGLHVVEHPVSGPAVRLDLDEPRNFRRDP